MPPVRPIEEAPNEWRCEQDQKFIRVGSVINKSYSLVSCPQVVVDDLPPKRYLFPLQLKLNAVLAILLITFHTQELCAH